MMPADEDDPKNARCIFEQTPKSTEDMREAFSSGYYDLVDPADWDDIYKLTTDNWMGGAEKDVRQNIDRRYASNPRPLHDVWEVWFEWYIDEKGPDGSKQRRCYKLMGDYHVGAQRFLYIAENPYEHKLAPYVILPEYEENGRFGGPSTVGKTKKHQALVSQMLHLDTQNAVQANWMSWLVDPESEAYTSIAQANWKVEPGQIIPGDPQKPPIERLEAGRNHVGLLDRSHFVMNDLKETLGATPWKSGNPVGANRTPASTVDQIMNAGYQKPLMELRLVSDALSELSRLYLSTLRQFAPEGIAIPSIDPETREILMLPMMIPGDDILKNFRIALTASDEELEREANMEDRMLMNKLLQENAGTIAQITGALSNPQAPMGLKTVFMDLLEGITESLKLVIQPVRRDTRRLIVKPESLERSLFAGLMATSQRPI